jgi:NUMOD3 motif
MLRRNCHDNSKMQKDHNIYGSDSFIYQRLLMGTGCTKPQLEWLEVQILSTLPEEKRYNIYVDWHKRNPGLNPFYGRRHTPETRAALSETRKGVASNFKGHSQSNAVRELISQQNSGQSSQERRKPVYIDIDEVFYFFVSRKEKSFAFTFLETITKKKNFFVCFKITVVILKTAKRSRVV